MILPCSCKPQRIMTFEIYHCHFKKHPHLCVQSAMLGFILRVTKVLPSRNLYNQNSDRPTYDNKLDKCHHGLCTPTVYLYCSTHLLYSSWVCSSDQMHLKSWTTVTVPGTGHNPDYEGWFFFLLACWLYGCCYLQIPQGS